MRRAAERAGLPLVLSFTVETDGALPGGKPLAVAIAEVDDATPSYYMINCAHPRHFGRELRSGAPWVGRIGGLRANASANMTKGGKVKWRRTRANVSVGLFN